MSCGSFIPEVLRYWFPFLSTADIYVPMEGLSYRPDRSVTYIPSMEDKKVVEWKDGNLHVPKSVHEFRERILNGEKGSRLLGVNEAGRSESAIKSEQRRVCRLLSLSLHSDKIQHIEDINAKADLDELMKIVNRISNSLNS